MATDDVAARLVAQYKGNPHALAAWLLTVDLLADDDSELLTYVTDASASVRPRCSVVINSDNTEVALTMRTPSAALEALMLNDAEPGDFAGDGNVADCEAAAREANELQRVLRKASTQLVALRVGAQFRSVLDRRRLGDIDWLVSSTSHDINALFRTGSERAWSLPALPAEADLCALRVRDAATGTELASFESALSGARLLLNGMHAERDSRAAEEVDYRVAMARSKAALMLRTPMPSAAFTHMFERHMATILASSSSIVDADASAAAAAATTTTPIAAAVDGAVAEEKTAAVMDVDDDDDAKDKSPPKRTRKRPARRQPATARRSSPRTKKVAVEEQQPQQPPAQQQQPASPLRTRRGRVLPPPPPPTTTASSEFESNDDDTPHPASPQQLRHSAKAVAAMRMAVDSDDDDDDDADEESSSDDEDDDYYRRGVITAKGPAWCAPSPPLASLLRAAADELAGAEYENAHLRRRLETCESALAALTARVVQLEERDNNDD
jgi:hypothetical protein